MDLNKHAPAGFGGFIRQLEKRAPIVRGLGRAEHAERDRHARIDSQGFEPITIVLNPFRVESGVFTGDLKHPRIQLAEHADQLTDLVPGSEPTRNRLAVRRLVVARARGGKAGGARLNGTADFTLHGFEIVVGRFFSKSPLTHDVGPQRGMTDIGRIVNAFGQPLNRIQVFRIGGPTPLDACFHGFRRNVFGALQIPHHQQFVFFTARGEREAAVTHHHAGNAMPARACTQRVPKHLGVHVRMAVNKAGGNDMPLGIDDFPGVLTNFANGDNFARSDSDIGLKAGQPGTINHRTVFNKEIVLHAASYRLCRREKASQDRRITQR